MKKVKKQWIEYSSNNSGGSWWLSDKHWRALQKARWKVKWVKNDEFYNGEERWLGALAKRAMKKFSSVSEAIKEFEKVTKLKATDEGCNCCGAPHSFHWGRAVEENALPEDAEYGYASGEQLLKYLYPNKKIPKDLREAMGRK